MKKTIQTIAIALTTTVFFVACNKETEAFNAKLKVGSKEFDVITADYPSRDTTVGQITKKGTNYAGQGTLGDSDTTATRTN